MLRAERVSPPVGEPGGDPPRPGRLATGSLSPDRRLFRELYYRDTPRAARFRYLLLLLDVVTLVFIIATSFVERGHWVEVADTALGLVLLAEFAARLRGSPRPIRELSHPVTLLDLVAILCFLIPQLGAVAGFLRALRVVRLLRSHRLITRLRRDFPRLRLYEDSCIAGADLLVYVFIMTGLVYETQWRVNPGITNYADALYFTITALTTTGFGDITLQGTTGRLLTVVIMLLGVTLFLRLAQALFRPPKIRFTCPSCGLRRHEPDAVHCKACGLLLNLPDDGA